MHVSILYDVSDDILNVRLQTLGVMEHSFPVHMAGRTYNWKLYDVGGAVSGCISLYIRFLIFFSVGRCYKFLLQLLSLIS